MVGVPGKSKGCITCKKRRIKCDETKPTCKRCEKAGYACAGYSTGLHFVNKSTAPFQQDENQSTGDVQYVRNTPVKVVPRMRIAAVPPELSLVAFQTDVYLSFMLSNFVWRTYGHGWLECAAMKKLDKLSAQATGALSGFFFGMSHHQEDIQLKAAIQYGKAISLLRPALSDSTQVGIENLLVPILVLLMHASYEEDQGASIAHFRGLTMLLQVSGPYRFQKGPIHKAFESARATLTTAHLIARQRLFLEQGQWKRIPWALDPTSKSQQNLILDILVVIPGFLQEDTQLQQTDDPTLRASLLSRIQSSLYALHNWRYVWEMLNPNAAYETLSTIAPSKPRVIPRKLHFRTHEQAAEILLYNATHMWLIGLLLRLTPTTATSIIPSTATLAAHDASFPDSYPRSCLLLPDDVRSLRDCAVEIVRAFEFQMTDPLKNRSSSLFFLFPLGIAYAVLEQEREYRVWIRDLLEQSPVTAGYAIGRNVWFGHYYMPKVFKVGSSSEPVLVGVFPCPGCGESVCKGGHAPVAVTEGGGSGAVARGGGEV